jgi:hypothetical protein
MKMIGAAPSVKSRGCPETGGGNAGGKGAGHGAPRPRSPSRLSWLVKERQGESCEGNARRFFCCAKDQHWIAGMPRDGRG